ncbi:hypothetical protein STXM2123_1291 [Streptomyces sp. F-3]|nr:hypothetical protein STXM2123_1291 [Streptomyces sp. F-3]
MRRSCAVVWALSHCACAGQRQVDGCSRDMVDCRGHVRRQERKPVRIRRGPATVTGRATSREPGTLPVGLVEPGRGHPE